MILSFTPEEASQARLAAIKLCAERVKTTTSLAAWQQYENDIAIIGELEANSKEAANG